MHTNFSNRQHQVLHYKHESDINTSHSYGQDSAPYLNFDSINHLDKMAILTPNFSLRQHDQINQNAADENAKFIEKLLTEYSFSNEKGQRIYGPPKDWSSDPPEHGCEVFIGHIPRDCLENELIGVFSKIGRIYQFRLMMESPSCNRGFGFCCYTNKEDTKRAMEELNNYEIRPGKAIGVQLSVDNCKLFVGGIPTNKKRDEILEEMKKVTEHVKDVIVYPSIEDKNKNRGFAFVEYASHRAATIARQKLQKAPFKLWNKICHVDWAEPEPQVSDEIMAKVTNLHARNLLDETTEDDIRRIFVEASGGEVTSVVKVRKLKDCAFIHFKDRESADKARTKLNNTCFDGGVEIEVNWAKPDQKKLSQDGKNINSRLPQFAKVTSNDLFQCDFSTLLGQYSGLATQPHWFAQTVLGYPSITGLPANTENWQNKNYRRNAAGTKTLITANNRKHPIETLDNYCTSMGLERPQYNTTQTQVQNPETGLTDTRYQAEVTLPGTSIYFATQPNLYTNIDDAMTACAQIGLTTLMNTVQESHQFEDVVAYSYEEPSLTTNPHLACKLMSLSLNGEGNFDKRHAELLDESENNTTMLNNSAANETTISQRHYQYHAENGNILPHYNVVNYGYFTNHGNSTANFALNHALALPTPMIGMSGPISNYVGGVNAVLSQQNSVTGPLVEDVGQAQSNASLLPQKLNQQHLLNNMISSGSPQSGHFASNPNTFLQNAALGSLAAGGMNTLLHQQAHNLVSAHNTPMMGIDPMAVSGLYSTTSEGNLDLNSLSSLMRSGTPLQQQFVTLDQGQLAAQNLMSQDPFKLSQMTTQNNFMNTIGASGQKNLVAGVPGAELAGNSTGDNSAGPS